MNVIVIAGGLGTRLSSVVRDVPKPLAPVAGRPFLEHLLDFWRVQGATRFILSVGYKHEMVTQCIGATYCSIPVDYAIESEPLGTGGGVLLALSRRRLEGPVFAVNGDTFFPVDAAALRQYHDAAESEFTLALFRNNDPARYASVECDAEGRVTEICVATSKTGALANGGVYLMNPDALLRAGFRPGDAASLEGEILPAMISSGARVFGFKSDARFLDIGVPQDYARAAAVIRGAATTDCSE